ncbi:ketohydroxyglutarate aldolase [Kordiimonas sediminis]|uniref:2-dehydro-3-deoxy-phosphogluconate aldolase n=1 Tax=Kordiimonas sediminis TaxID=1735581 RepID=A0A919AK19_9PROT|nr:bifunctional 4-hydroxy-2-oxoglutarate aldolase/2-dehydro-3-deoxy-phosphogluconate aldolase [Kordiimonas sediminis]GHF13414.1 ketohydroxyglutarate aldolase [Kordiimonas sediminis]
MSSGFDIEAVFAAGPVIPVLSFSSVGEAVETCQTLYDAGMRVFEITLRHPTAIAQIRAVVDTLPGDAIVGAGTVMNAALLSDAQHAGAKFGVSPGLTANLAESAQTSNWPFLPGVATVSEAMQAHAWGFDFLKFFPAETAGGAGFLKSLYAVLPDVRFCPTGGITPEKAPGYLELGNVPVVGGSWIIARNDVGRTDHPETAARAKAALLL